MKRRKGRQQNARYFEAEGIIKLKGRKTEFASREFG